MPLLTIFPPVAASGAGFGIGVFAEENCEFQQEVCFGAVESYEFFEYVFICVATFVDFEEPIGCEQTS